MPLVKNFTSFHLRALHRPTHGKHFSSLVQSTASQDRCLRRDRSGGCSSGFRLLRDAENAERRVSTVTADPVFAQNSRGPTRARLPLLPLFRRRGRPLERADRQHLLELPPTRAARQPQAGPSPQVDESRPSPDTTENRSSGCGSTNPRTTCISITPPT